MRWRVATSSLASTFTVSWNTGAAHASVRRAIVFRVDVSSTISIPAAARRPPPRQAGGSRPSRCLPAITRPSGSVPTIRQVDPTLARSAARAGAFTRSPGALAGVGACAEPTSASGTWDTVSVGADGSTASSTGASAVGTGAAAGAAVAGGAPPLPPCASARSADTSSSCAPMIPTVVPTSTSPSATTIFRRTPSDSASTSWVTLSVSSS